MKPSRWPDWLNNVPLREDKNDCLNNTSRCGGGNVQEAEIVDLWAKSSTDPGSGQLGESLAEHTWLVLSRLAEIAQVHSQLAAHLCAPRLWHCLFWACFLHDFGKAAKGFQSMLRQPENKWQRRHEVLSLAFLDWIAPAFSQEEQQWMLAAIVSHHRDAKVILDTYCSHPDLLEEMVEELDESVLRGLWRWLFECPASWMEDLGFVSLGVQHISIVDEESAVQLVKKKGSLLIRRWLDVYATSMDTWRRPRYQTIVPTLVMLRGLTTSADHAASAHLPYFPPGIQESWLALSKRLEDAFYAQQWENLKARKWTWETLKKRIVAVTQAMARQLGLVWGRTMSIYAHQRACAALFQTSTWLIAPTGSGKTEAALFWILGDGSTSAPRMFYTLPYQASMNAMYQRLCLPHYFSETSVGLQHGRALQAVYARMLNAETGARSAGQETKWRLNLNKLHAYPIKVFSPYQMLKVLYQLKGFEAMLTDYTQAAFIFDEIHAYDASRLALIFALIKHLREVYGARFLLMSATFPSLLQDLMPDILGVQEPVRAEPALFKEFRRHRLVLLDGDLLTHGKERILADVRAGKSVLVCCNTVRRAQGMRKALLEGDDSLNVDQVELLHSRFTMRDRTKHEQAVFQRCASGKKHEALVVVATQVVEVSLNIDLNTIYSDPAPLDALIQRFGRVNRARLLKDLAFVHVFREPRSGQGVYLPLLVARTLDELERHNGAEIDEAEIGIWLDGIYNDPEIRDPWLKRYQSQFRLAEQLLRMLRPFQSDEEVEKQFEELFDGVEVLPVSLEADYRQYIADGDFIEASRLFVPISSKRCKSLVAKGQLKLLDEKSDRRWIAYLKYDEIFGLQFESSATEEDES